MYCLRGDWRYQRGNLNWLRGVWYPRELIVHNLMYQALIPSHLDLHLEIDKEGWLITTLYDKRDDFNFLIAPCGSYQDFLDRGLLLARKLLNQGFRLAKLKPSLREFYGRHHDLVDIYLCHKWPRICSTYRKHFPVLSSFTGFVTRLTRLVQLVEQEQLTLPEHQSSSPVI